MKITKCSTIDDIIKYGNSLPISHDKIHLKSSLKDTMGNNVIVNYSSFVNKYIDFLQPIIVEVTLTDNEYEKYKFQPKFLSFDMYGTTELWSSILLLNNLSSATEFTKKKIKLFTKDIFTFLNEILILEDDNIKDNKKENNI